MGGGDEGGGDAATRFDGFGEVGGSRRSLGTSLIRFSPAATNATRKPRAWLRNDGAMS